MRLLVDSRELGCVGGSVVADRYVASVRAITNRHDRVRPRTEIRLARDCPRAGALSNDGHTHDGVASLWR